MFDKIFGAKPPAKDESGVQQSKDGSRDAAIEHCVRPEGQGILRGIFLNDEGGNLLDQGDYPGAIERFEAAIAAAPFNWVAGNAYVMLGIVQEQIGRVDLARESFTQGLRHSCTSPSEAYRRRSFTQAALGDVSAALSDMRRALEQGEDAAFAAAKIAAYHLLTGDSGAALRAVRETPDTRGAKPGSRLFQMQSRAEIDLLHGNRESVAADLNLEATLADGDDGELAIWRYVLWRRLGFDLPSRTVEQTIAGLGEESYIWLTARWFATRDATVRDAALAAIEKLPGAADRITGLCQTHFLLGAAAEYEGAKDAAHHHFLLATANPEPAWCIEYALAQYGLRRVEG